MQSKLRGLTEENRGLRSNEMLRDVLLQPLKGVKGRSLKEFEDNLGGLR